MAGSSSTVFGPISFTSPSPPDATSIAPGQGFDTGGLSVDIYGSNFVSGCTVDFGGAAATGVIFVDSGHIVCTTPAHTAGIVLVTVTNPDTRSDPTPIQFTYVADIPPVAAFIGAPEQRDDRSYLVDATFEMSKTQGAHLYAGFKYGAQKWGLDDEVFPISMDSAQYSTDDGNTWQTASPQTYDRKHTAETPMNVTGTPTEFTFVWNAFWDLPEDFEGYTKIRFTMSGSPSVTITSSSFWVSTVVSIPSITLVSERRRAFKINDYLGEGPIAPWRRGPSDFNTARGAVLVNSAVQSILKTKAATDKWGGELEWDPGFGALFWALKHTQGDEITLEIGKGYAELALGQEPRITFRDADVRYEEKDGSQAMFIKVLYTLITSDTDDNQVILPDLQETTIEV